MIKKGNTKVLVYLAEKVFNRPQSTDMHDLLKLMIETNNTEVLTSLAIYTFSEVHNNSNIELLKQFVETADAESVGYVKNYTFPKVQQVADMDLEYRILKRSLDIKDPKERKEFIEAKLQEIDSPLATKKTLKQVSDVKPVSASLQPGNTVRIDGELMSVIKKAGEGKR